MTDSLQIIIDRHAAATPGPAFVDVIDDHGPDGKSWLICDVVRTRWGNNALNFDGDEATARFVAASFTDVPAMAAALQRAASHLADMEHALANGEASPRLFKLAVDGLRNALNLDAAE